MMHVPRLPACQLCHDRKTKCDNKRPTCEPCAKAGVECYIAVPDGYGRITRQYIHELEQRQTTSDSLSGLGEAGLPQQNQDSNVRNTHGQADVRSNLSGPSIENPELGSGGLDFMTRLFTNPEWKDNHADLLHNLSRSIALAEATVRPNALPGPSDARIYFDKYLSGTHVHCPVLLRTDVQRLYSRVFDETHKSTLSPHDLYRTFIVMALGSITLYRTGNCSHHPFGFYLSAIEQFNPQFLDRGLEGIQDLQLIIRFGIYYHIGTSLWEINRTCIRMCTELGLHNPPIVPTSLIEEQLQRRVFWQSYLIDRYSCSILDRPFAIADCDIKVELPVDADDDEIQTVGEIFAGLSSVETNRTLSRPSDMSVFRHCIRLRQISSTIHRIFSKYQHFAAKEPMQAELPFVTGKIYSNLDLMIERLDEWHTASPRYTNPRCLYETYEWYGFLRVREKLQMIRKALDLVPKRRGLPPKDLLFLCLEIAIQIVSIFSRLYEQKLATYTRSYFSSMFTSGLSMMLCVSLASNAEEFRGAETATALGACEKILRAMGKELPDTRHYVAVFEVLNRNTFTKMRRFLDLDSLPIARSEPTLHNGASISFGDASDQQLSGNGTSSGARNSRNISPFLGWQATDAFSSGEDVLNWAFLGDDALWNLEAGLGEYVYGDLHGNDFFGGLDFVG